MKLINKLLPIATICSTVAIVTPILTSCSNGVSKLDWKPTSKHNYEEITLSYDNLDQYKKISADYYESNNNKNFVEDMYYTEIEQIQNSLDSLKKVEGVKDANVDFNITISDVKLTSQEANVLIDGVMHKMPGYKVSLKINVDTTFTYEIVEQIKFEGLNRIESKCKKISHTQQAISDYFTCLIPVTSNKHFRYIVNTISDNDWKDTITGSTSYYSDSKYIYDSGKTYNISTTTNDNFKDEYTKEQQEYIMCISDNSYYLSNVTFKF